MAPRRWRALDLDGQALLFDRTMGLNVLVANGATAGLRRTAPRTLQVALTNACDKSCAFCYRPLEARSRWTFEGIVELARFADEWGVLELAFGGGEPTLFPRFAELLETIWNETGLCPSFTTHGLRLTSDFLQRIRGSYGQLQVSVYDEDDTFAIVDLLAKERARFGLNYLVTPARARTVEADVLALADRGARDFLFLSYKGNDTRLHLSEEETRAFDESLAKLHHLLGRSVALKVDVCWAGRIRHAPQLLYETDCQANVDFLGITSDRRVVSCSFKAGGVSFEHVSEIRSIYDAMRSERIAAESPGCARLPDHGLAKGRRPLPLVT